MPKQLKYCLALLLTFYLHQIVAQSHKYLLLEKGPGRKKLRIYPGSDITLRFYGDRIFYTRQIKDISGDLIIFENAVVKYTEIAEIDISNLGQRSTLITELGRKLPIAGVGYFAIDNFNRSVVMNQPFNIDEKVARSSGIMVGVGLLFVLFHKKTFKVRGRNRLSIVNLLPE